MAVIQFRTGSFVASSVFEVVSVPSAKMINDDEQEAEEFVQNSFNRLVSELHKVCSANATAIEILWVSEEAKNQTFKSKVHIYIILREIGTNAQSLEAELAGVQETMCATLNKMKFATQNVELVGSDFSFLMKHVDCSTMYACVKREEVVDNSFSAGCYYKWNRLSIESTDDMSGFVNEMSKYTNCAVSFHIIPTALSQEETKALSEISNIYQQMAVGGSMASRSMVRDASIHMPIKSIEYDILNSQKPMFFYGICVFGKSDAVRFISAKLNTLLTSGKKEISECNPIFLDLSAEKINLSNHFFMYPWLINSSLLNKYRNSFCKQAAQNLLVYKMPYLMTSDEVNVFFRLPLYKTVTPALTQNKSAGAAEQFSDAIIGKNTIKFGTVISDNSEQVEIGCPLKPWTQHALIVGMPGTGKTTFAINILTQFTKMGIPFLAIEPTKNEYRAMIDAIPNLQIFTPGNNKVSPFIINPFIPPEGITVEQYVPSLMSAFKAAFAMEGALEMLFMKAINKCYIDYGWKKTSKTGDSDVQPFGLYEYILCFKKVMGSMHYAKEVQSNLETAGLLRLMNLIEQNSNIYDNIHTIPISELLRKPTVLELNAIDNQEQKALIMALLLSNICVHTKNNQKGEGTLKNIILIDEAHVLLDAGASSENGNKSSDTTVKTIQNMIAEIRSYGTGIIIADQKPSKVTDDIVANTNIKVAFRLTAPKERNIIKESTDMSESNADYLSKLGVGQAFVYFDMLNSPQLVQSEDTRERDGIRISVSDKEITERSVYWKDKSKRLIPYRECSCAGCLECSFKIRADAEFWAEKILSAALPKIKSKKTLLGYTIKVPELIGKHLAKYPAEQVNQLCSCVKVKLIRKAKLSLPYEVSLNELKQIIAYKEK